MIIEIRYGFSVVAVLKAINGVKNGMRTIASYMAKNDLKDCTAFQLINGECAGKGWRIWRTDGTYYYRLNDINRKAVRIGRMEELC